MAPLEAPRPFSLALTPYALRGDRIADFAIHPVDVHERLLYYVVSAWSPGFAGGPVDYGTHPDQPARGSAHQMAATPSRDGTKKVPRVFMADPPMLRFLSNTIISGNKGHFPLCDEKQQVAPLG